MIPMIGTYQECLSGTDAACRVVSEAGVAGPKLRKNAANAASAIANTRRSIVECDTGVAAACDRVVTSPFAQSAETERATQNKSAIARFAAVRGSCSTGSLHDCEEAMKSPFSTGSTRDQLAGMLRDATRLRDEMKACQQGAVQACKAVLAMTMIEEPSRTETENLLTVAKQMEDLTQQCGGGSVIACDTLLDHPKLGAANRARVMQMRSELPMLTRASFALEQSITRLASNPKSSERRAFYWIFGLMATAAIIFGPAFCLPSVPRWPMIGIGCVVVASASVAGWWINLRHEHAMQREADARRQADRAAELETNGNPIALQVAIRSALRRKLKAPESAVFSQETIYRLRKKPYIYTFCGNINAKNSYNSMAGDSAYYVYFNYQNGSEDHAAWGASSLTACNSTEASRDWEKVY